MTWLLCDYGEVLCLPQPEETITALAALAGMERAAFQVAYWRGRAAYDRGDLDAGQYWTATLGAAPGDRLPRLVDLDAGSWLHPNTASLEGVARAAERGLRPAILSNAPRDVGTAIDAQPWLAPFSPRIFSYQLGAVKPEAAAYALALDRLGARPADVLFVDDRPANVDAARAAGIRAELFSGPAQWDGFG